MNYSRAEMETSIVWDEEEKIKYRSRPMFMICVEKRPGE